MKTLTIDEALERLEAEWSCHRALRNPRYAAILNDFERANWEAAQLVAERASVAHLDMQSEHSIERSIVNYAGHFICSAIEDAIDARFPTTNPTQAGTMTDGPCGTCGNGGSVVVDSSKIGEPASLAVEPCPDCKPSAPDTKGDPE